MSISIADDRGKRLLLAGEPRRVVSLVPSDSYNLCRLGAATRLVGRTEYCVEPARELDGVEAIGGTKNASVSRIVELAPDLVIANQEENSRRDIEALEESGLTVLVSFPRTVAAGLEHVERLAVCFPSLAGAAARLIDGAKQSFRALASSTQVPLPTFVPIWMNPLMTIHGDTFISDALELCGGRNVFSDRERRYPLAADLGNAEALPKERTSERDTRYPRVTLEEVVARAPQLVLLPDEPHEFSEADAEVFRELPLDCQVSFCDGRDLMWYGLRSLEGLDRIAALIDAARPGAA